MIGLILRELVRFYRQRSRILLALLLPLVFWVILGPRIGFPANIVISLLLTALFSTLSILEDRTEGFLQGALVAPVSRSGVVLGKAIGGTLIGVLQGLCVLCLAPLAGVSLTFNEVLLALLGMTVLFGALSFTLAIYVVGYRPKEIFA